MQLDFTITLIIPSPSIYFKCGIKKTSFENESNDVFYT